jgi:16S rRNA (cytosine1402-N4)-methyltransferase
MRKDRRMELSAAEVLHSFPEAKLAEIFSRYGEFAEARRLAKKIIEKRLFAKLQSTVQLRLLVEDVTRWRPRPGLLHPAAKVFQALRIFINHELDGVESWLDKIPSNVRAGGRVIFITYHSLEDRLVKKGFQRLQLLEKVKLLRPFPRFPGAEELAQNLASRSAKMRALEVA